MKPTNKRMKVVHRISLKEGMFIVQHGKGTDAQPLVLVGKPVTSQADVALLLPDHVSEVMIDPDFDYEAWKREQAEEKDMQRRAEEERKKADDAAKKAEEAARERVRQEERERENLRRQAIERAEQARKKAALQAREQAEAEARQKEERAKIAAQEQRRKADAEREKAALEARNRALAEARRLEEERKKAAEVAKRQAELERKKAAEQRRKHEELERKKAEEEARKLAEKARREAEEERRKAEELRRRQAQELARKKARKKAMEEAERLKLERIKAEEAAREKAEEEARRAEEARRREEAKRKAEAKRKEEEARKLAELAELQARQQAEEERQRAEKKRKKAEAERKKAAEAAKMRAELERKQEEEKRKQEEDARRQRRAAQEKAQAKAEVEKEEQKKAEALRAAKQTQLEHEAARKNAEETRRKIQIDALRNQLPTARKQYRAALRFMAKIFLAARQRRRFNPHSADPLLKALLETARINPSALTAVLLRDGSSDYAVSHSVNVGVLSLAFGSYLGLPEAQLHNLGLAALFHDIGRARIPMTILEKPGKLTDKERQLVRSRPATGANMLRELGGSGGVQAVEPEVVRAVREHHERHDGSGYPDGLTGGLAGEAICKAARILAVADIFDAMTTKTPYRIPQPPPKILGRMYQWSGSLFDPEVAERFIKFMGIYPVGSLVRLSGGSYENLRGVVMAVQPRAPLRPTVRVCLDAAMNPLRPRLLHLSAQGNEGVSVSEFLDPIALGVDVLALMR